MGLVDSNQIKAKGVPSNRSPGSLQLTALKTTLPEKASSCTAQKATKLSPKLWAPEGQAKPAAQKVSDFKNKKGHCHP